MKFIWFILLALFALNAKSNLVIKNGINNLLNYQDIKQNYSALRGLKVSLISFREGRFNWHLLLIINKKAPKGPFWFLPHDNENSAFKSAIYATKRYGGGFLAVVNNNRRYNLGQDPNRNFSLSFQKEPSCKYQLAPSPIYTKTVMQIINSYKAPNMPYLALHNNTNKGGISILKDTKFTKSFLAYSKKEVLKGRGLADEDSLVYIAGSLPNPPISKVKKLLNMGLNVKYEYVTRANNDCSMSNFIILNYGSNYYNIETEHGKVATQKEMIDRLMRIIY